MGYLHIGNLYKAKEILLFRECYALEKIHGTSSHVRWDGERVTYFPGGVKLDAFKACFTPDLETRIKARFGFSIGTLYGEAYGGNCQAMRHTYGPELRFIVFDVQIHFRWRDARWCDAQWCDVPKAASVAALLGLEFVPYRLVSTKIETLNAERDRPSEVAVRRGMGMDRPREGVVLRPPIEVTLSDGSRVIAKHKGEAFSELTRTPKAQHDGKLEVLKAREAAEQWVTPMRLQHVVGVLQAAYGARELSVSDTGSIIKAMLEDVCREGAGEVVDDLDTRKALAARTARLWKQACRAEIET